MFVLRRLACIIVVSCCVVSCCGCGMCVCVLCFLLWFADVAPCYVLLSVCCDVLCFLLWFIVACGVYLCGVTGGVLVVPGVV